MSWLQKILDAWQRRLCRRQLRHVLRDARHVRNLREDVAPADALRRLAEAEHAALTALHMEKNPAQLAAAMEKLATAVRPLVPPRKYGSLAENIEVIVVAVAVAMAFRTYFIQPFKIPTSSMYPSLHGIKYAIAPSEPGLLDRWPLKIGKWLIFGEWYTEIRAKNAGTVQFVRQPQGYFLLVNDTPHQIFENMSLYVSHGQMVYAGQRLAAGIRTAGDHIFVNRFIWHFRRPRRGEIMVFKTTGIEHPQIKKNEFYVKRMVGLPGETLRIDPPHLLVNDQPVLSPPVMQLIQSAAHGYAGYVDAGDFLERCHHRVALGPDDYFACGDNQRNSLDSRYWGPVKRRNLIGPTFFVYWPISKRWGWAR